MNLRALWVMLVFIVQTKLRHLVYSDESYKGSYHHPITLKVCMCKTVNIIGAGPCGFGVARALLAENAQFHIRLFDGKSRFGGVWDYVPGSGPMYRDLDTNIPHKIMEYSHRPFSGPSGLFPTRDEVLKYVTQYSEEVSDHPDVDVKLGTPVSRLSKNGEKWLVETPSGNYDSDYTVIAAGHFRDPYFPPIPGLKEWAQKDPSFVRHSMDYDAPEEFADKRVLVIGNSSSGTDVTVQLLRHTAPVTISRMRESPTDGAFAEDPEAIVWKPEIESISDKTVYFKDGTQGHYDRIIACTGYLFDFPFLDWNPNIPFLHPKRSRLENMYLDTIHIGDPTLAVTTMSLNIVPFPISEAQGSIIAGLWSNRLKMPPQSESLAEEARRVEEKGDGREFPVLPHGQDVQLMRRIWNWNSSVPGGFDCEVWDEDKLQLRSKVAEIKNRQFHEKVRLARQQREGR